MLNNHKLKFLIALMVMFAVGYVCSSDKDDKKEDKKEDTKKEDTKKEDTKSDERKTDERKTDETSSSDIKLYFVEEYTGGKEIGKSDEFIIGKNGGYFTCMIDMRGTGKKIGVGKLELRITKLGPSEKIIATEKFDVQPDWDYIFFDKFHTFYSAGDYKVTAMKPDGTPVATGEVKISMR
ncbi:MAG TPA: hypothetical protein PK605_06635 [Ignavibacteria bacterium]|nr:hypothetical protein [Bacteroidota bacterium]HRE10933.1 hypothetical protein [Ignavibacteria bacterium]HRF66716.1 hypothetical protein [Ignavibacteria bacterium]HRJ04061.1 hypothetical protein [Ignavibacteria bacterium]HRJ86826.1 hypothetical protein [Ignavibacteria bacterium]